MALPEEQPLNYKGQKTAHVKPFLSPNSKSQGQMGDVAAVSRNNWRSLTTGSGGGSSGGSNSGSNSGSRDFLADQRRQLAEIERMRGMGAAMASNSGSNPRNARSQSVLPPSGAGRPTNHLEVNKMAQVCFCNFN